MPKYHDINNPSQEGFYKGPDLLQKLNIRRKTSELLDIRIFFQYLQGKLAETSAEAMSQEGIWEELPLT